MSNEKETGHLIESTTKTIVLNQSGMPEIEPLGFTSVSGEWVDLAGTTDSNLDE